MGSCHVFSKNRAMVLLKHQAGQAGGERDNSARKYNGIPE